MLADAKGIHAELVGQRRLIDQVADDLGVGLQTAVAASGDIAERVQSELKLLCHDALRKHDPAPKRDRWWENLRPECPSSRVRKSLSQLSFPRKVWRTR